MDNVSIQKNWMNNSSFFIAKNFSALKHKSIVFLCIQYTEANILKSINWKYMEALTFDLRWVFNIWNIISLWNIKARQNLILWLVALYLYWSRQDCKDIQRTYVRLFFFFLQDSDSPYQSNIFFSVCQQVFEKYFLKKFCKKVLQCMKMYAIIRYNQN